MKILRLHPRQTVMLADAVKLMLDAAMETAALSDDAADCDQTLICMAFVLAPWLIVHDLMAGEITKDEAEEINQLASGLAEGLEEWMGDRWQEMIAPRH